MDYRVTDSGDGGWGDRQTGHCHFTVEKGETRRPVSVKVRQLRAQSALPAQGLSCYPRLFTVSISRLTDEKARENVFFCQQTRSSLKWKQRPDESE